jgi:hypothetical protein
MKAKFEALKRLAGHFTGSLMCAASLIAQKKE